MRKLTQENRNKKFSIIIPAHNEEKYIAGCLESIKAASKRYKDQVEIIVVLNRCTDRTEEIAKSYNAITIKNKDKNLSKIRNAGAKVATGDILITIDADTKMSKGFLSRVNLLLSSGLFIGGGTSGLFDRMSLGILTSVAAISIPMLIKYGLIAVGIFWCYRKDFVAINGFNEELLMAEDADFAHRLMMWGLVNRKLFGIIPFGMLTSSRKFDKFGDWVMVINPRYIWSYLKGTDKKRAEELYYDY
ncbi:glycosyltransferase [Peribacillus sp. B-H-3]|uniref:glycosyltransferase n=1 Tax=Peribacillus sp. B-H-3 TaxID=3400420 RepID=UPI003B02EC65